MFNLDDERLREIQPNLGDDGIETILGNFWIKRDESRN